MNPSLSNRGHSGEASIFDRLTSTFQRLPAPERYLERISIRYDPRQYSSCAELTAEKFMAAKNWFIAQRIAMNDMQSGVARSETVTDKATGLKFNYVGGHEEEVWRVCFPERVSANADAQE